MNNLTDNASKTLQWLASYLNSNNVEFVSKKLTELVDNLSKISVPEASSHPEPAKPPLVTEDPSTKYSEKDQYEQFYNNEYSGLNSKHGCLEPVPYAPPVTSSPSETTKLVDHAWAGIAKQTEMTMNMQRLIIHQLAQINTSLSMAIVKMVNPPEADKKP